MDNEAYGGNEFEDEEREKALLEDKLSGQRKEFSETARKELHDGGAQRITAPKCSSWLSFLSVLVVFPLQTMQLSLALFFGLLYFVPLSRVPLACYITYTYLDKTPANGGWRGPLRTYLRRLSIWKFAAAYYPMELVKTCDLDPSKSYVFGYHPHGLFGAGACNLYGCNALSFDELFPGVDVTLMTLKATFLVPFFREWILAHGISSCDKETCIKLLKSQRSIAIIIGGARESLDSRPGVMKFFLKSRKGFVRVALASGASLVPSIGFAENDLFGQLSNPKGSYLRWFQDVFRATFSFTIPLAYGRFAFPFPLPTIPLKKKVVIALGPPIDTASYGGNTDETIVAQVHKQYIAAVEELYGKYAPPGSPPLEIV